MIFSPASRIIKKYKLTILGSKGNCVFIHGMGKRDKMKMKGMMEGTRLKI